MAFLPSATSFSTSARIAWGSTEEEDEGAGASAGLGEEGSDLGVLERGFVSVENRRVRIRDRVLTSWMGGGFRQVTCVEKGRMDGNRQRHLQCVQFIWDSYASKPWISRLNRRRGSFHLKVDEPN